MFEKIKAFLGGNKLNLTHSLMKSEYKKWTDLFYLDSGYVSVSKFAKILTAYMASLASNEISIHAGSSMRAAYIDTQIREHVSNHISGIIQLAGVCGFVILRPIVQDKALTVDVITPDRIDVEYINSLGIIERGTFKDYTKYKGRDVVRLEQFNYYQNGFYIHNEVHYISNFDIGGEINIKEIPQWADIPTDYVYRNVDRPLFAMLKMPFQNTVDRTSRLPVSIYADSVGAIIELDYICNQFLREIDTGKRKQIIDRTAIRLNKDGVMRSLKDANLTGLSNKDLTTDLYLKLDMDEGQKPFEDYTPTIRVEEYRKSIDTQLRLIEMQTGFSSGTFNLDIKTGMVTATQVISDARNTYNTIKAIQDNGLYKGLIDLIYCFDVLSTIYNLAPVGTIDPVVSFGDSIFEDTGTEFSRRKQLVDSGYLKPEKLTAWYFGVSEEEAIKEYMPEPETELFEDEGLANTAAFR